jgi:hypothetical protein
MGAPSSQVQSSQSSAPAGKGASASPSSQPMGKGSMSATSGQPTMGQPNTNSNTGLGMANPTMIAQNDGQTSGNPYPNTVGQMNAPAVMDNQPKTNQSNFGGKGKGA